MIYYLNAYGKNISVCFGMQFDCIEIYNFSQDEIYACWLQKIKLFLYVGVILTFGQVAIGIKSTCSIPILSSFSSPSVVKDVVHIKLVRVFFKPQQMASVCR